MPRPGAGKRPAPPARSSHRVLLQMQRRHKKGSAPVLVLAPVGLEVLTARDTPLAPQPSSGFRTPTRSSFRFLQLRLRPRGRPGCECS